MHTTSNVLASQWCNGVAGFVGVLVHSHADAIALVDSVHVESSESSMGGDGGKLEQ